MQVLKISRNEQGSTPGFSGDPSMVKVLPEVVCPYMNIVELKPFIALLTHSLHDSLYKSCVFTLGPNILSKVNL